MRYNLNVCSKEELTLLLIKLNGYTLSANALDIEIPVICGYGIEQWMPDIKAKLKVYAVRDKESKLKSLEFQLTQLLSEDKKTELEIDRIAELSK